MRRQFLLIGFAALLLCGLGTRAEAIDTAAREAFMIDADTHTVLLNKNADHRMPPASMSKLMTAYVVFDRLNSGRLSLDDTLLVSEKAWKMGGSKMFVEVGNRVSVENLLRGVIIDSGNDACIVLAEGIAGSESAFAEEMNREAKKLGLTASHFNNATGWPDPEHVMSARDLAMVAEAIMREFPQFYHFYSETEFTWNDITQKNRNPLLYSNIGADGLKTGHTSEAGYGLTASAVQDGRRLILVVTGLSSERERATEAERLLTWGFREYTNLKLFSKDEVVETAAVWHGESDSVPLVADKDVVLTLAHGARDSLKATVVYDGPIPAPISAGDRLATLRLEAPGIEPTEIPLVAGESVERLGPVGRILATLQHLVVSSL
mgnify:CR=1 FL=1